MLWPNSTFSQCIFANTQDFLNNIFFFFPSFLSPQNLSAEKFNENCMRCGRILLDPGYQKWRWTGFQFGLDLIIVCNSRVLSIRRHHRNEHERLLSLQVKRQFMIRSENNF